MRRANHYDSKGRGGQDVYHGNADDAAISDDDTVRVIGPSLHLHEKPCEQYKLFNASRAHKTRVASNNYGAIGSTRVHGNLRSPR